MANVYDTANQLEREIRELDQFKALGDSFGKLKESEEAYGLFKEFQSFQQNLQQRMAAGEEMTDEDASKAQTLAERIQKEPLISDLMEKEQSFSLVVNDLNRIIMEPLRELYEG
ncbi:MAG TPA: YlbF family regulator [Candidatus Tetragenococcus pullicola]|nr:YlbF family regulator [Candidatus Tetragenococcus pullicola]